MPPLLFYGGTFDPVHNGHLAIAVVAGAALGVEVRLMPAADPPHRAAPGASAAQRAAMLDLAVQGRPGLCVDRRELARTARSYTIDTLNELRAAIGADRPVAFLIGADSFLALPTWKDWRALLDGAHFVIAERPGSALDSALRAAPKATGDAASDGGGRAVADASADTANAGGLDPALAQAVAGRWVVDAAALHDAPGGRLLRLRQPLHGASASEIRRRIAAGQPWREHLPPAVADYIERHRLYRPAAAAGL